MTRIAVTDLTRVDATGAASPVAGLSSQQDLVPHALRQALQSLGCEIDDFDRVEIDGLDASALKAAYERFAGPSRDRSGV